MRQTIFLVMTVLVAYVSLTNAKSSIQTDNIAINTVTNLVHGGNTRRYLKGTSQSTEDENTEERDWGEIAGKLQDVEARSKLEGQTAETSEWQSLAAKIKDGQLQNLDTKQSKWQSAFAKLKASGELKNANEEQVAKVTEEAAQTLKEDPKKWPKLKRALDITFGAAMTAFIVLGIEGMLSE